MNRSVALRCIHNRHLLWLAAILVVLLALAFGQAESDPWLIVTNGEKGSINARTTREDLVRLYGAENVVDGDVDVGEGDTEPGTVLFPNDPERTVEILWQDHDKKANPSRVTISGKTSRWHAVHGISLGTSYTELERLNGKPFPVSWGTDQDSVVLSWNGGQLEIALKGEGQVFVWLDQPPSNSAGPSGTSQKGSNGLKGPRGKQERRVDQIAWEFPTR
jgi:hypothetical protein